MTITLGVGTQKAMSVFFPFSSGTTLSTALVVSVDARVIFWATCSFPERPCIVSLTGGSDGMDCAIELAMGRIILQYVALVVEINEGVIDGNNIHFSRVKSSSGDQCPIWTNPIVTSIISGMMHRRMKLSKKRACSKMMNRNSENRYPCLVLDLKGRAFSLSSSCSFFVDVFYQADEVSFYCQVTKNFH